MELGVFSTMVTGESLRDKMAALKDLGYDFIELRLGPEDVEQFGPQYTDAIKADAEATGMPVHQVVLQSFSSFLERCAEEESRVAVLDGIAKTAELVHALGGDLILLPAWDGVCPDDGYETYGKYLGEVAPKAEALGVKLAVEHIPSSKFTGTIEGVTKIARATGRPNVGVYADIGNAKHAGEDSTAAIRAAGDRIFAMHFKAFKDEIPLEKMPLDETRAVLEEIGFEGRGAVEMRGGEDNEVLKMAISVLREHGI